MNILPSPTSESVLTVAAFGESRLGGWDGGGDSTSGWPYTLGRNTSSNFICSFCGRLADERSPDGKKYSLVFWPALLDSLELHVLLGDGAGLSSSPWLGVPDYWFSPETQNPLYSQSE